jgi:predicted acyl esterase
MRSRVLSALAFALVPALAACSADAVNPLAVTAVAGPEPGDADFTVRGSVRQVFVTHAEPGAGLELRDADDATLATGTADHLGSLVFRKLPPGKEYRVHTVGASKATRSDAVDVVDEAGSLPPPSFYAEQKLAPGTGYIVVRDGTTLAINVTMPGPPEDGPYPTIVNYSGYDPARPGEPVVHGKQESYCAAIPVLCDAPSDASALIMAASGYATVSVNIRGTGCSGGAYDYFEALQLLDGYDVIEAVAAQDWVKGHKVGMTGLSYPGITQLFVAKTRPPSLAAIVPLSVIGNTATTLVPGGLLNEGFALSWIEHVYDRAAPYGQGWEQKKVDAGDTICAENQLLHDQRVNNVEQARSQTYYVPEIVDPLNPTKWVDQIDVPVFLAGGFQDEQTGPFFTTLLDRFSSAPSRRFTVYNGVHPDGFSPQVLVEWKAFLDLYVAEQVPSYGLAIPLLAPQVAAEAFGVELQVPDNRWAKYTTWEDAKAAWEAEPEVRAIFENGATEPIGAPHGRFEASFDAWPPKETEPRRFWFQPDGSLGPKPPEVKDAASTFRLDPTAGARGILGDGPGIWDSLPAYDWRAPAEGYAVGFTTPPLDEDLVMLGTGSVDLYLRSPVDDADLEVNLTEVRPDGQERYVQSGWLRASFRELDAASSTELWPAPSMLGSDVVPLEPGTWTPVRVAIAGFNHVFRKGSRIRVAVDTPGDSRSDWRFGLKTFPGPVTYEIGHGSATPSSVLLPVVRGVKAPAELPPCPSLRGQPCRPFTDTPNVLAK